MNINDEKYRTLRALALSGGLNDMELAFLLDDNGAKNINDGEMARWAAEGYSGNINDRRVAYLKAAGYTGSINDLMTAAYGADGYYTTPIPESYYGWDTASAAVTGSPTNTFSNDNKTVVMSTTAPTYVSNKGGIAKTSGKLYFEILITSVTSATNNVGVGIVPSTATLQAYWQNQTGTGQTSYHKNGQVFRNGAATYVGAYATYTNGDVISVYLDFAATKFYVWKNNTDTGIAPSFSGTSIVPYITAAAGGAVTATLRVKASDQSYTPVSGYTPWENV